MPYPPHMQTDAADMISRYHVKGIITFVASLLNFYIVKANYRKGAPLFALAMFSWYIAVMGISYSDPFFQSPTEWTEGKSDFIGFLMFLVAIMAPLTIFATFFREVSSFRRHVILVIPTGSIVSIHILRLLYGIWFVLIFLGSKKHDNFFLVSGCLEGFVGSVSPFIGLLIHMTGVKDNGFWLRHWNRAGLIAAVFSYSLIILNFIGQHDAPHPLSVVGFFPLSIVFLYLYPINIATHLLIYLYGNEMEQQFKKD